MPVPRRIGRSGASSAGQILSAPSASRYAWRSGASSSFLDAGPPGDMGFFGRASQPYHETISTGGSLGGDGSCNERFTIALGWRQTAVDTNPSESGSFLASCAYDKANKRVYLFGSTDSIAYSAVYDCNNDTYTQIGDLPTASGQQTFAAVAAGKAWIFGGGAGVPFSATSPTAGIQSYDLSQTPGTGTTYSTIGAVLPYSAYGLFGDYDPVTARIICGGGADNIAGPPGNATAYKHWLSFDPANPGTNPTALLDIPVELHEAACARLGRKIYVIGGSVNGTPETIGTTGVYEYDIDANTWATKNAFPVTIAVGRACANNGKLYCGGGWTSAGFSFSSKNANDGIYVYNPAADSWSLHSTTVQQAAGSLLVAL